MFRIGQGYDVHRFAPEGTLVVGGVEVSREIGVVAHSDGDVLLHALCDALLGAIAAGDIGAWFPDTDPLWRGADSGALLATVVDHLHGRGYRVVNVDSTVIAQVPRMAPHVAAIRERVAQLLQVPVDAVAVKATTSEGLGFVGRREGIAAQAVALVTSAAVDPERPRDGG